MKENLLLISNVYYKMSERKLIEPKQVIVVRKDLNMSPGKLAAQVSHASLAPITNKLSRKCNDNNHISYSMDIKDNKQDKAVDLWLNNRFTKIVVYVKSEEALKNIFKKAQDKGLISALIQDAGFTEFNNIPTYTCVGIGPCFPEEFEGITNKLRLL